jgi:hypothetical protein
VSIFRVEDGHSRFLQNIGILLPNYTASHPRRPTVSIFYCEDGHSRLLQIIGILLLNYTASHPRRPLSSLQKQLIFCHIKISISFN